MTGQELNKWIAENVMGLTVEERDFEYDGQKMPYTYCAGAPQGELPHYSTNPADAMAVLERCLEKVNCSEIQIYQREDDFFVLSHGAIHFSESNLPKAICSFAKLLFGKATQ